MLTRITALAAHSRFAHGSLRIRSRDAEAPLTAYEAANETRVIAGRPARFLYSPPGPGFDDYFPIRIEVFDPETEVTYDVDAIDDKLVENPDAVLELARSLFGDDAD